MPNERLAKLPHKRHALINLSDFDSQQVPHPEALIGATGCEELADLVQRKAYVLRLPNELDALHRFRSKDPKPPFRTGGTRQEPALFIVADGINAHAGASGDFANLEHLAIHKSESTP